MATESEIAAAALAALPGATSKRLHRLWHDHGDPFTAFTAVREGRTGDEHWAEFRSTDSWPQRARPESIGALLERRRSRVLYPGGPEWPFADDVEDAPAILFTEGACPEALRQGSVSIVGTRAASPHGLTDAHDIAHVAARAGWTVVSGLAIGIDAAAHRGAIAAGGLTVGVVATGLDVVYPRRHTDLFAQVRERGLVVGEYAYGTRPDAWRFPVRNRIIAALGAVCVVVEAQATGGALITANLAAALNRPVLAMPGSRRNPAAAGTNELLRDGASPLLDPSDLFVALELATAKQLPSLWQHDRAVAMSSRAATVLRACGGESATLDRIQAACGLSVAEVSGALRELERIAKIERKHGKYWPK